MMMQTKRFRLGLIGDNIAASQSPRLHVLAGRLCGLDVTYERLVPAQMGKSFEEVFTWCQEEQFAGVNVTYPYKERVTKHVQVPDEAVAAIGACNTVIFDAPMPHGANTDHSGFMRAFRTAFGTRKPGRVAMAGAGGVGKAIGFALAGLCCEGLTIFDTDRSRAEPLVSELQAAFPMPVEIAPTVEDAMRGADGLVNCTPLGMVGYGGSAFPSSLIGGQTWAFDAVYTPVETEFLTACAQAAIAVLSGYELFFFQGVDAFRLFTGADVDTQALRQALLVPPAAGEIF
jgi:shikimate dehydrogenase